MHFGFKIVFVSLIIFQLLFTNINPQCSEEDEEEGEDSDESETSSSEAHHHHGQSHDKHEESRYDSCCSFPCQHGGICISKGAHYECDCMNTGYFGKNCDRAALGTMLQNIFVPNPEVEQYLETHCEFFWAFVNSLSVLHRMAIRAIYQIRYDMMKTPPAYMIGHDYISQNMYYNTSMYARELQSIPSKCPKQMGNKGPTTLPPAEEVVEYLLERDEFKPCPYGTNLMFAAYAHHFTHQFFKSDLKDIGVTQGTHMVDASQIYGFTEEERHHFRTHKDGKLKVSIINNQEFPPHLDEVPHVKMHYPEGSTIEQKMKHYHARKVSHHVKPKFALAHPQFASTPFIFAMSTIWIREHNRVCDKLKQAHQSWDDERLYQTAKLIITAEMLKITMEEYVQHLSQYKLKLIYDPTLAYKSNIQYHNTISMEFNLMHHWHALLPEILKIKGKVYNFTDLTFTCNEIAHSNLDELMNAMMRTPSGQVTARNYPKWLKFVAIMGIEWGRKLRLQSFNNYRRSFGLAPYRSFLDMAGDPEIASALECLYRDVDAVEFFPGILIEKHTGSIVGPSMAVIGGAWSMKTLLASPVGSPGWWKPSSFGGSVGWNIVQNASLHNLVCNNLKNKCRGMHVGFAVTQKCLREIRRRMDRKKHSDHQYHHHHHTHD